MNYLVVGILLAAFLLTSPLPDELTNDKSEMTIMALLIIFIWPVFVVYMCIDLINKNNKM